MAIDRAEQVIRTAAVLTTSYVASSVVAMRDLGFTEVDYLVRVDDAGTLTSIEIGIQYSLQSTPVVWNAMQTESVTEGVSTLYPYVIQKASPTTADLIAFTVPVRGQYQRLMIKGTGTVSGCSISAYALRRG